MTSYSWPPLEQISQYANFAAFPPTAANGSFAVALDTGTLYEYNANTPGWQPVAGDGSGSVTSVALADGSTSPIFAISGSPVTVAGTLTMTLQAQTHNAVLAGPAISGTAQPTFRALVLADLPAISDGVLLGNISGGSAAPAEITATEVTALLDTFTSSLQGLAPASGGGTANFLRADGTWAAPAGTGVTSVAFADSTGLFNVTGTPITGSGTLTLSSFKSQSQNSFLAAPSGSAGAASFRAIAVSDVPTLNQNTTGTAANVTASSNATLVTLSALTTAASLATVGTISAGTWHGTAIGATYGGTGLDTSASTGVPSIASGTWSVNATLGVALGGTSFASYTIGDMLYASGSTTLSKLTIGTVNKLLVSTGSAPSYALLVNANVDAAAAISISKLSGVAASGANSDITSLTAVTALTRAAGVAVHGTNTNDDGAAGYVGECIHSEASGVSLTSNTTANVTSIPLTAGDWDVSAAVGFGTAGTTTVTQLAAGCSLTTATLPASTGVATGNESRMQQNFSSFSPGSTTSTVGIPSYRVSVAANTTLYLVARAVFGTSTCTAGGYISARRAR